MQFPKTLNVQEPYLAMDSQDEVRHPDKETDKTILLISRHYWRPDRRSDGQELYRCRHIPAYRSSDSLELELDLELLPGCW